MTEEKIRELIEKYAEGTATEVETWQLMQWYQTGGEEVVWSSSNPEEEKSVYNRMLQRLQKERPAKLSRIFNFSPFRAAAVLLISFGMGLVVYFLLPVKDPFLTIQNPSGRIALIKLPDNTKVWLNASTTLRYKKSFTENRDVQVE